MRPLDMAYLDALLKIIQTKRQMSALERALVELEKELEEIKEERAERDRSGRMRGVETGGRRK